MAKKPDGSTKVTGLRRQAEELLRTTKRDVAAMPVKDVQQLVHELQVHQIELEMQNDELRRTQVELETARDRYVDLYDFSPAGHLTLDTHGKIVEANLRAGTLLGINRNELIRQPLARFVAAEDESIFRRHYQEVLKRGTRQTCEMQLRKASGASRWVYFESLAVHEEPGHITHWRTSLLDISDRKLAEEVVKAQRAQLEGIIASAMDAIITVDEGEHVVIFNRAAESMFLCQGADAIGQPFDRFIPERFRQAHHGHMSVFALTQATSRSMGLSNTLLGLRANGEEFPVEASISHARVDDKELLTVILRDVTERKRTEAAMREALETLDATRDGAFIFDPRTLRFSHVNEGAVRQVGYSREELLRMTPLDIKPEFDEPRFRAMIAPLVSGAESAHSFTTVHRRKDGVDVPVEINLQCVGVGTAQPRLVAIVRDITERNRAMQEQNRLIEDLIQSEQHFQTLFNWTPSAVGISTLAEGRFCDVNDGFSRLTGYAREEVIGRTTLELGLWADPSKRASVLGEIREQGYLHNREGLLRTKSGEIRSILVSVDSIQLGSTPCLIYLAHDITERKRAEEALRESEARLRAILENSPGMVFLKDVEGRYLDVNRQFERTFHLIRQDIIGKTDHDIFPPEQATAFRANDLKVLEAGGSLQFEEVALHNGGPHTSIVSKFSLRRLDGTPYAICGIVTDITERKVAEAALQASDAFARAVLNSLSAHVCVLDKDGVIVKTNDAWKEFARCNSNPAVAGDDVGQNYLDVCRRAIAGGQSTAQVIVEGVEAVLGGRQPSFSAEYPCHSPEEERWFLMRVTQLKESQGGVISHTDISAQIQMARSLEQHILLLGEKREELESLTGKLIQAQEQERKRIARELHDDFNQRLAALSVELETLERAPIAPPEPIAQQLAVIRDHVGHLSDDLHDLAYRLHPSLLEHVGLEVAARDHVAEFTKRTGLPVTFTAREVPGTLSPEIATNLFRMMQESLQNVSRHAQATEVMVSLSGSSKGIGLSVRDNGKGFELKNKNARVKGLGLVSMQERARGLGGFLRIHSLPREGTKVCAWIPLAQKGA